MRKLVSLVLSVGFVIGMTPLGSMRVYADEPDTGEVIAEEVPDEEEPEFMQVEEEQENDSEEEIFTEVQAEDITEEPEVEEEITETVTEENLEEDSFDKDAVDGAGVVSPLPKVRGLELNIHSNGGEVESSAFWWGYSSFYDKYEEDTDAIIEVKLYKDGKPVTTRTAKVDIAAGYQEIDFTDLIPSDSKSEFYLEAQFKPGKNETRYSAGEKATSEKAVPYEYTVRSIKIRPVNVYEGDNNVEFYLDYSGLQGLYNYGYFTINGKKGNSYQMATTAVKGYSHSTAKSENESGFKAGDKIEFVTWLGEKRNSDRVVVQDKITVIVQERKRVSYSTHVQTYGWQSEVYNGSLAGTVGESKRLEAIKIKLVNPEYSGDIEYRTHVQTYGWQDWKKNGITSGTSGKSKRLEAVQIRLTGKMAEHYDVYYRTQIESFGWLGWAKNGEYSGSAGYGKRLEAIQIMLVQKDKKLDYTDMNEKAGFANPEKTPSVSSYVAKAPSVEYQTHIEKIGWQGLKINGEMSGTSGQAKRLEAIKINLSKPPYEGGITYRTHVQKYGWRSWSNDGAISGTTGEAKRLEAIQIKLTGEMADKYDVYYRVHAQSYGWLGWAKNGESAGTSGYAKRLEGIQIVLVDKGKAGPDKTYRGITSDKTTAYISK